MLSSAVIECISDNSSLCMLVMIAQLLRVVNIWYEFFMQTLDIVFVILVVSMNMEYFFQYNGNIIELFLSNYFKSFPNSTRIINFP